MWDLFKSEFARYRLFAWGFCVTQVLAWVMVGRATVILQPGSTRNVILMLSVVIAGAAFAILSMSLHKRKSQWAYLVHRPLAIGQIHLAVSLAALALLFIGFVLPFTATLSFLDLFTNNVVEPRHYFYAFHMFMVVSVSYFLGTFAVLTPSKGAYLAIWGVTFLILRQSTPLLQDIVVDMVFFALSYTLAKGAFKVDLSTFNQSRGGLILSALIIQPALLVILVLSQSVYYHVPLITIGAHPENDESRNAFYTFKREEVKDQFATLLAQSESVKKETLTRQLDLAEFERMPTHNRYPAIKQQLFVKDNYMGITEPGTTVLWIFSHSEMLLMGRDILSDEFKGYLGLNGFIGVDEPIDATDRFKQIPGIYGANMITYNNQMFEVDFKYRQLRLKHEIESGDQYVASPVSAFDHIWLKTEKALHVLDKTDFNNSFYAIKSRYVYPHPVNSKWDLGIDITEVPDGFLVLYGSRNFNGYAKGGASLVFIRHEGKPQELASMNFAKQQVADWVYFQKFILSPVVMNLVEGSMGTILQFRPLPPKGQHYFWQQGHNIGVYLLSGLILMFSALATYLLASRRGLNDRDRNMWTLMNLFLSLPGLIGFLLLTKKQSSAQGVSHV